MYISEFDFLVGGISLDESSKCPNLPLADLVYVCFPLEIFSISTPKYGWEFVSCNIVPPNL